MRALLIAGLALGLPAAMAVAQQVGPPIPLVQPPGPAPQPPATASPAPAAVPAVPGRTIAGEPLGSPAVGWTGETSPSADALPREFWHGTPRALAEMLLARLPDTTSPALQALVRRLLLSPGAAPAGDDPAGTPVLLPGLHAAALLRLGETEAARHVIDAVPEQHRAALQPLAVEADAIAGHVDEACDKVGAAIRGDQSAFWQRALIACQIMRGEAEKASLGLQLLGEQEHAPGAEHDRALAVAVDALAGRPAPAVVERLDDPDPLLLRALSAAKRRFAPALIASLRADLALTLARDEQEAAETRLAAAERAALCGALPVERLRELYAAIAAAAAAAGSTDGTLERARRFAAIAEAGAPAERLARIAAFADAFPAKDGGGLFLAARLVAPELKNVAPDAGLANAAAGAARLLLAVGDDDAARRWLALDPARAPELRSVLALAGAEDSAAEGGADGGKASTPRPTLLALRLALGRSVAVDEWARLPAAAWSAPGGPAGSAASWLELSDAAAGKRVGETVLAAVVVAAPQGEVAKDPVALYAVVKALDRVGLAADARWLAVEAALVR